VRGEVTKGEGTMTAEERADVLVCEVYSATGCQWGKAASMRQTLASALLAAEEAAYERGKRDAIGACPHTPSGNHVVGGLGPLGYCCLCRKPVGPLASPSAKGER
jgi:histidinol phosphatase-like enzyme